MPAAKYDFTIEQGATFSLGFAWKSDDGIAVDLTGYTARMQVRQSVGSPDVLLDATTENGLLSIDEETGRVNISLPASVTTAMTWRRGRYDIEVEAPDGTVTRLVEGSAIVSREVTRE
jgi:hypothetical protein